MLAFDNPIRSQGTSPIICDDLFSCSPPAQDLLKDEGAERAVSFQAKCTLLWPHGEEHRAWTM
jgi:hypothetical protein